MNQAEWEQTFEKYKTSAKKQYESLHADMDLKGFKRIYFWEYIHRMWARTMGLVFIFPFLFFLLKKWIPRPLLYRLLVIIALASLEGLFGWIMVASGLNDDSRTWVSAYKLIIHLMIATILFGYLCKTWLLVIQAKVSDSHLKGLRVASGFIIGLLLIQILFGGLMAGMRAGLLHPHFPAFVHWQGLQSALDEGVPKDWKGFMNYEPNTWIKAVVQLIHRAMASTLVLLTLLLLYRASRSSISSKLKWATYILAGVVVLQFILGALTVINSIGKIPATYGVLHQGMALILLAALIYTQHQTSKQISWNS